MDKWKRAKKEESGAIVIEATLSLTAFVFVMFTILSVVNICYIQAKMSLALNYAAKDISQYTYLYYKLDADNLEKNLNAGTEDARTTAKNTIDGIGSFMEEMAGAGESIDMDAMTVDFDSLTASLEGAAGSIDGIVNMYAQKLSDDPKGFIIGMGKMAGNELKEEVKVFLAQAMAKAFMKKNLKAYEGDDPDEFLRRYRVKDGMDGLDFDYSSLMAYGSTDQIQLVVTYKVSVIRLLNIDFDFTFRQCAQTEAWGNGISLMEAEETLPSDGSSVWDNPSAVTRGKIIVSEEKKKYTFTDSGHGFDAYNNSGGANEFIAITSANIYEETYLNDSGEIKESAIKSKLASSFNSMYRSVSGMDENINVTDKSGNSVTLSSSKKTRTYKVVLVVPDDAETGEGSAIDNAVKRFKEDRPDYKIEVTVKKGYGNPKSEEAE